MLINRKRRLGNQSGGVVAPPQARPQTAAGGSAWAQFVLPALLIASWGSVLFGLPVYLPTQAASWLTFLALFIAPGYLLGELLARRLGLELMERLALAFPLGVAALTPVGLAALLQHWTVDQLALGWAVTSGAIIAGWALAWLAWARQPAAPSGERWKPDEALLAALLAAVFVVMLPTLNLYKIDGDAYAVNSFSADALAGLPLNATEPIFGTDLGPGVRMAFNQSLPMSYLWSYWSGIAPIPLSATASRAMLALWSMLATYTLGRAAGMGLPGILNGRRFALFVVAIQLLIYLAAPFLRGDNVSLFFFERISADKFMVPVTMLPVAFALAIRFLRSGEIRTWLAAAVVTFAVSAIHPLIAAMLALALGAFAALHFLLEWRIPVVRWRSLVLGTLAGLAMFLPLVQLVLARGEAPLAASYPSSLEEWPVGYKMVPALPFVYLPTLDITGPLPDLSQLEASEVNGATDPFLIWRFAVNMNRRRLLLFDVDSYISDPNIALEPPYLLAILLLPLLLPGLRRSLGAQFALATALAVLFVMFNPVLTPMIGSLVMPWILWRFIWLLPYALILGLAAAPLVNLAGRAVRQVTGRPGPARFVPLVVVAAVGLLFSPMVVRNLQMLHERAAYPYFYPTPERLLARLDELTEAHGPATVLADQDLSVSIPAYVAHAHIVAHRVPTTSEVFPAGQQEEAMQRLIDQEAFFRSRYITQETVDILRRYAVGYIVAPSGSNLDIQLRLAPGWFEWVMDDQSYTLYRVAELPVATGAIRGNTALAERRWVEAEEFYRAELDQDPRQLLAMVGMAEIAHARGRFNEALKWYAQALEQTDLPVLHFRLGQLHTQLGQIERAVAEYDLAQQGAPYVARFHVSAGDACLSAGLEECAAEQYTAAVENRNLPDPASHLIALADLWRQRNRTDLALGLYEEAVALQPSLANQLMLASAYWEEARYAEAEALLGLLRARHPLSAEVLALSAEVEAGQGAVDEAVALYRRAVWIQEATGQEAAASRLALARVLLSANRLDQAQTEIERVLTLQPNNAAAHALQGDLYSARGQAEPATVAYQKAFRLDPTQVQLYLALSNQFRQLGGEQEEMLNLLETAMRANPDEATLALALGDQLQRQGEAARAIDAYQAALDMFELASLSPNLAPRGADTSRAYAYIRLASVSEDLGQMEPAMNYFSAAVAAAPDLPWTQVAYGDALRRRNDVAAAETAYRRAIANDPNSANAYVQLADLLTANGNSVEAQVLRRQALDVAFALAAAPQSSKALPGLSKTAPEGDAPASFDSDTQPNAGGDARSEADRLLGELAGQGASLFAVDDGLGVLNLLTRLSQTTGDIDRVVELYRRALEQGLREGWYPVVLAQYYKGLGDLYLAQGLPALAAESYRSAIAQDSWWPQPRLGLARALESLGQSDEALAQLENAAELAPGFVEAQVALATFYDQLHMQDQALEVYRSTADAHPGNPRATLALAQAWQDRGLWDEAERTYRRTIALTPGNSEAYVALGALLVDMARYAEAQPMLVAALETNQENINAYIQMGVLEQRQGHPDLALDWFKRAVRVQPEDQPTSLVLLDLMQRYGHFEASLDYLRQDLAIYPQDVELLLRQARAQRILGKTGEAMATLLEASRLNLADSRLSAELGELYIAQGRPQAALAAYRQTVALEPGEDVYYIRLAELWQSQAQFEQAEATLMLGLRHAVRGDPIYAALADLYLRQGRVQDAKDLLDRALDEEGPEPSLVLAMGAFHEAQAAQGTAADDRAEGWYTDFLAERPDESAVRVALGDHYLRRGKTAEAIAEYERVLALEPTVTGHYLAVAEAYVTANRLDEAETALTQARLLEPTLPDTYLALAKLYRQQSRFEEARTVYQSGLALAPTNGTLLVAYADLLISQGEQELGNQMLAKADQIAPTVPMLLARAAVYQGLRMHGEALADLQAARQKEPGTLDVLLALGDLYRVMGDNANAQETYAEASKLTPGIAAGRVRLARLTQ